MICQLNTQSSVNIYSPIHYPFLNSSLWFRQMFSHTKVSFPETAQSVWIWVMKTWRKTFNAKQCYSILFLLDKIESIKEILPRHLLCVRHHPRGRGKSSKQKKIFLPAQGLHSNVIHSNIFCRNSSGDCDMPVTTIIVRVESPESSTDPALPSSPPLW